MLESNMACPWGVTTTVKNQYIVVDHTLNNIKVFGPKGNLIRTFGSVGKNDGQLNGPIGVSSDADCNIYVADFSYVPFHPSSTFVFLRHHSHFFLYRNQRYDVFDINGNFLSKNGRSGSLDGEFSNPWGIAIDPNNQDIVVADASNCRIQVNLPPSSPFLCQSKDPFKKNNFPWSCDFLVHMVFLLIPLFLGFRQNWQI